MDSQLALPFEDDGPRPVPPKAERRPIRMHLPTSTRIMRAHLKLFHGVWISPSAPLEEMYECHSAITPDIPHHHDGDEDTSQPAEMPATDHGFW